jgi:hypothetical protein
MHLMSRVFLCEMTRRALRRHSLLQQQIFLFDHLVSAREE